MQVGNIVGNYVMLHDTHKVNNNNIYYNCYYYYKQSSLWCHWFLPLWYTSSSRPSFQSSWFDQLDAPRRQALQYKIPHSRPKLHGMRTRRSMHMYGMYMYIPDLPSGFSLVVFTYSAQWMSCPNHHTCTLHPHAVLDMIGRSSLSIRQKIRPEYWRGSSNSRGEYGICGSGITSVSIICNVM